MRSDDSETDGASKAASVYKTGGETTTLQAEDSEQMPRSRPRIDSGYLGELPPGVEEHQRGQMMGFVAYAQNINESVKILCMSKMV